MPSAAEIYLMRIWEKLQTWTPGSGGGGGGGGGLTNTELRATPVPVNGTVTVSNPTTNPETGLAKDGTDINTPTAMPAGGVGIRGWLSAIWTKLNGSIAVTTTFPTTQPVSVAASQIVAAAALDGSNVTEGAKADTAVTDSTTTNTKMSFLKGAVKILADVWVSASHWLLVQVAASENHVGEVTPGHFVTLTQEITFNTSAGAYHANDAVLVAAGTANELTGFARVAAGSAAIVDLRLITNTKSIVPSFRIHFFNASTVTLSADNANWQDKYADVLKRLGSLDMPAMTTAADATNSDISRSQLDLLNQSLFKPMNCVAAATSIWWALETLTAFTSGATEKLTLVAVVQQF